jgi:hypothetical protein
METEDEVTESSYLLVITTLPIPTAILADETKANMIDCHHV